MEHAGEDFVVSGIRGSSAAFDGCLFVIHFLVNSANFSLDFGRVVDDRRTEFGG